MDNKAVSPSLERLVWNIICPSIMDNTGVINSFCRSNCFYALPVVLIVVTFPLKFSFNHPTHVIGNADAPLFVGAAFYFINGLLYGRALYKHCSFLYIINTFYTGNVIFFSHSWNTSINYCGNRTIRYIWECLNQNKVNA
jgi:hypothetical protein